MNIDGKPFTTLWLAADGWTVEVLDQRLLPHRVEVRRLQTLADAAHAIREMVVRGAPLIGVTAAYGLSLALRADPSDAGLSTACDTLLATRPTAVNLRWGLEEIRRAVVPLPPGERAGAAYALAAQIRTDDIAICSAMGDHGREVIRALWEKKGRPERLNLLTHCNAGWLAAVDWGTALAPVYKAHEAGIPLHVWVDETRPRSQGASLTAFELLHHGVPHTVVVDNVGGHLMQHGEVDLCIVGTDRTAANGDVCNKVGTYLKALAAHDNGVPFYVGLPSPTIDWEISDGVREIPIEQRDAREVTEVTGRNVADGTTATIQITPDGSPAANYAFDVTPARLITGLITERGVCPASRAGLTRLFERPTAPALEAAERRATFRPETAGAVAAGATVGVGNPSAPRSAVA